MKKLIIILFVLLSLGVKAQITLDTIYEFYLDSATWTDVKEYTIYQGDSIENDSVEYIFKRMPVELDLTRLPEQYVYNTDSTAFIFKTKIVRAVVYRSRKVGIQRLNNIYKKVQVKPTDTQKMLDLLKKGKNLGVNNNDTFWNHPLVKEVTDNQHFAE